MAGLNDVRIERVSGGLGRVEASIDAVSCLVASGVSIPGGLQHDTLYELRSVADLESLQVLPLYDLAGVVIHGQVKDFFTVAPAGSTLFLFVMATNATLQQIIEKIPTIATAAEGKINQFAAAYNGSESTVNLFQTAVPQAQTVANQLATAHMPALIVLEAVNIAPGYLKPRTLNSPDVCVVLGTTKAIEVIRPTACAVGAILGAFAKASVNENIGWVEKFNVQGGNIQFPQIGDLLVSAISETQLVTYQNDGFIFFRKHTNLDGIYINESSTAMTVIDDFAYGENVRTVNKAGRIARRELLPFLNSPVEIDPVSGQLAAIAVKTIEAKVQKAITEQMLRQGEVSGFTFKIDPAQNILSTSELLCQLTIVPTGTARNITVQIKFSNPFV
jgi:hypothetical protein